MPAHMIGRVVEIQRVRRDAVDQRGIERAGAPVRAENQGRAVAGPQLQYFHDDLRGVLGGAGESDTHRVEHGDLAPLDGFRRKVLVAHRLDAFCELARQAHRVAFREQGIHHARSSGRSLRTSVTRSIFHTASHRARARLPSTGRHQVVALLVDFRPRHRVLRGAAHRPGVVPQFAPVLQLELDDALALRAALQFVVADEFDAAAQRQHLAGPACASRRARRRR